MANYYGFTRTNYFRVTDSERLKKIIDSTYADGEKTHLYERSSGENTYYAFGCYGTIAGLPEDWERTDAVEHNDLDYDAYFETLVEELSEILHPDDAIIITEVGYEKLRYLTAYSTIITRFEVETVELRGSSIEMARKLLNNPSWDTVMEY